MKALCYQIDFLPLRSKVIQQSCKISVNAEDYSGHYFIFSYQPENLTTIHDFFDK
ncbi:hypothetical protein D083_2497 [Dickeya solani RNS 08.23.3.1.A]|nr:hypothetical protein D083_2497 [Dickeya solani RNS 08.23.3.1.A]